MNQGMTIPTGPVPLLTAGELSRRLAELDPTTVITWTEWDEQLEDTVIVGVADIDDEGHVDTGWLDASGGRDTPTGPREPVQTLTYDEWVAQENPANPSLYEYLSAVTDQALNAA
jgi:hypothetical protein